MSVEKVAASLTTRPLTDREILNSVDLNLRRLIEAVFKMDEKSPQAVMEVSTSLRQLVAHGQGNRLLQRIAKRGLTSTPRLKQIEDGIDTSKRRDIRLALGALPSELVTQRVTAGTELEAFLLMPCLRVASLKRKEEVIYTWDELVSVIANKLGGAHTDEELPEILDDLACYLVAGVSVLRFALRTCAAAIASVGQMQVGEAGIKIALPPPPLFQPGSPELFGALVIGDLNDGHLDVRAKIRFRAGVQQQLVNLVRNGEPDWLFRPPEDVAPHVKPRSLLTAGRNHPCPCGSGMKFKRCCGRE